MPIASPTSKWRPPRPSGGCTPGISSKSSPTLATPAGTEWLMPLVNHDAQQGTGSARVVFVEGAAQPAVVLVVPASGADRFSADPHRSSVGDPAGAPDLLNGSDTVDP